MGNRFKKLMIVFRNTKYYSRNVNEGPTDTNGGTSSNAKDSSNPCIRLLKTVVVFCKANKAIRNMIVVFRHKDNHVSNKYGTPRKADKGLRNMVVTFRNRNNHIKSMNNSWKKKNEDG